MQLASLIYFNHFLSFFLILFLLFHSILFKAMYFIINIPAGFEALFKFPFLKWIPPMQPNQPSQIKKIKVTNIHIINLNPHFFVCLLYIFFYKPDRITSKMENLNFIGFHKINLQSDATAKSELFPLAKRMFFFIHYFKILFSDWGGIKIGIFLSRMSKKNCPIWE